MLNLNFTPFPELRTERLILRQMRAEDAPEVLIMRGDEELTRYTGGPRARTIEEVLAFIEKISRFIANNEAIYWIICLQHDPKPIGSIMLWNISQEKQSGELGYGLLHGFHGKGYMDEALRKVTEFGFGTMQLQTIEAYTREDNARSLLLLKKNNFVQTGYCSDPEISPKEGERMAIYALEK